MGIEDKNFLNLCHYVDTKSRNVSDESYAKHIITVYYKLCIHQQYFLPCHCPSFNCLTLVCCYCARFSCIDIGNDHIISDVSSS